MKKNLTELVLILDMSGSMASLTDDTIGGFNSVIRQNTDKDGEVLVTTYLFNGACKMLHDRVPIAEVRPMTTEDYRAGGCTALIDAMGQAIDHIVSIHRYAREEDIPEHTLFVITTDGWENASHRYTAEQVKEKVRHQQEKRGWEFVYLASNIDAVETAGRYGIAREYAVDTMPDAAGNALKYDSMARAVKLARNCRKLSEDKSWRDGSDRDFAKRGK